MENRKPKLAWGSENLKNAGLLWASILDNRFQLEVSRTTDRLGELVVYDHQINDKAIFARTVELSYGAIFGPDVEDINSWQKIVAAFVDNIYLTK